MNDYLSRAGKTLIIVLIVVCAVGIANSLSKRPKEIYIYIQDPNYIPSAREIQQRLKDLDDPRYDPGEIDGIPGPEMIRGWDNYICDRYAKRAVKGE